MIRALLLPLLFGGSAWGFCGTYVGGPDDELVNTASEVAMVRVGDQTTLTVRNDVQGDTSEFAMLVPVPEVLPFEAIHVLDHAVFDRLRTYSEPRLVSYECSDFAWEDEADGDSDTDAAGDADSDTDVDVEAEYVVGEYDVVLLSAGESTALVGWLNDNGYAVPEASADLLGEYIDGGSYFFAAKIHADAGIEPGDVLSPLQFTYTSEVFSLPIRIGTLNSPGEQDLNVYAITPFSDGSVGIANYREAHVEDECLWEPDGDETFGAFYEREFGEAYAEADGAVWVEEYAWGNGHCDPCTGVEPSATDMKSLGFPVETEQYFFTRLHLRYAPVEATQDLVLYTSGIHEQDQMRYIQHEAYLEDRYPICGLGWASDPGSCDDPSPGEDGEPDTASDEGDEVVLRAGGGACSTSPGAASWALIGLAALVGRRRFRS
jgi:MYXO-CTERM domain-containing protein